MPACRTFMEKTLRIVVVDDPRAVGDAVRERYCGDDIVLRQHVRAFQTPCFAFPCHDPYPAEHRAACALLLRWTMVFHMIPQSVSEAQEFIPDAFGILEGISVSAQFHLPLMAESFQRICLPIVSQSTAGIRMSETGQVAAAFKTVRPFRRCEGLLFVRFHDVEFDPVSHCVTARIRRAPRFAEFGCSFTSLTPCRSG